jgi:hypothetical protein
MEDVMSASRTSRRLVLAIFIAGFLSVSWAAVQSVSAATCVRQAYVVLAVYTGLNAGFNGNQLRTHTNRTVVAA